MRICFIVGQLGQGGAERQLYYYLKSIKDLADDIYVLSLTKNEFWEEPIKSLGIDVIWIGKSPLRLLRLIKILLVISKRPVGIIQSQHFFTNLYAYISAKILNIHCIGSSRSDIYYEINKLGKFGLLSLRLPKLLMVNSKIAEENAIKLGKSEKEIFLLPNFVDDNYFVPGNFKASETMTIIFVGSLIETKRIDRIIKLAKKCNDQKLNVRFIFYGDGEKRFELESFARSYGLLNSIVFFFGRIDDPLSVYQEANIFILTSDHEGTPNVVLEAMACGLPIISTKVGDVPLIVEQGVNGFLVDNDNESQLIGAITDLINNEQLRTQISMSNREKILRYYSFSRLREQMLNLYGNL